MTRDADLVAKGLMVAGLGCVAVGHVVERRRRVDTDTDDPRLARTRKIGSRPDLDDLPGEGA